MGGAPSLILPNLWLGGQDVINDPSFFETRKIDYVLSLGPATPAARISLVGREHINIPDVPQADLSRHLAKAVRFIAEGRHTNNSCVYVHCAAGISRSTTCLCAYLMVHLDMTFHEALTFIASRRRSVCPNEGFTRQLKRFEGSKERVELSEELARCCRNYQEMRSRDLEEVHRPPPGADKTSAASAKPPVGSRGRGPASSSLPPWRDPRSLGSARNADSTSVEHAAQQNALQAVRGAMSQYAQEQIGGRGGPQENGEGLRIGSGDSKGDVGLSWLLRPQAGTAGITPTAPAGRPSGGMRPLRDLPYHQPVGRRASNSTPAGRRSEAGRR